MYNIKTCLDSQALLCHILCMCVCVGAHACVCVWRDFLRDLSVDCSHALHWHHPNFLYQLQLVSPLYSLPISAKSVSPFLPMITFKEFLIQFMSTVPLLVINADIDKCFKCSEDVMCGDASMAIPARYITHMIYIHNLLLSQLIKQLVWIYWDSVLIPYRNITFLKHMSTHGTSGVTGNWSRVEVFHRLRNWADLLKRLVCCHSYCMCVYFYHLSPLLHFSNKLPNDV